MATRSGTRRLGPCAGSRRRGGLAPWRPTGDGSDPAAVPDQATAPQASGSRIRVQGYAGVDRVRIETWNTVREAAPRLETARPWLPAAVSFVCAPGALPFSGATSSRA